MTNLAVAGLTHKNVVFDFIQNIYSYEDQNNKCTHVKIVLFVYSK